MTALYRTLQTIPRLSHRGASPGLACPFSSSSAACVAPQPKPTRPLSQLNASTPRNIHELTEKYPNHPLLAFFHREEREVGKLDNGLPVKKNVPVSLPVGSLRFDSSSRAWLAPELRTKSSLELHQLWYKCLMERNRLATTRAEAQRVSAARVLGMLDYSGPSIERRVRKTMARIKSVLNERRMALLQAQQRAAQRETVSEIVESSQEEDMYEADSATPATQR